MKLFYWIGDWVIGGGRCDVFNFAKKKKKYKGEAPYGDLKSFWVWYYSIYLQNTWCIWFWVLMLDFHKS